ncbi:MAG: FAD-dependent oxidoreductase, partial [Planctomycetota bacterium]
MRVGVIGAGPAGLTTALTLARGGAEVEVFEASDRVGGLCRSIELWGQHVDVGPHRFFSADRRINEFWLEIVGEDYEMIDRLTRVFFRGRLIDYPIRPMGAIRKLGPLEAARCLVSYLGGKLTPTAAEDQSFEQWVVRRFGRRLFEVFFRSYSEKLWGIPCADLSADFASQRIREFSLWEAFTSAISKKRKERHKTLVDRFAYPIGGTGIVYDRIANKIAALGGRIHTSKSVMAVTREETRVTGLEFVDGERTRFDHVVSTMPLTLLVDCLHGESVP